MYKPVDSSIIEELERAVGSENLLTSEVDIEPYSHDEVAELHYMPEVVVKVRSAEEVSRILKFAQKENIPVTPRGAGYGLSGGAVPIYGGIVMSFENMDRILEIDQENLIATVEPGVITGNLHREVESVGLFYPPDPASLDSCTIGGNVAENAGGPRAIKYGVTQDYVTGMEVVLPSGEIVQMGGKVVKDVTGYNLMQLLLGSEGTLAVITKILLQLIPLPTERVDLLVPFGDFSGAAKSVSDIIKARIVPAALEFMERDSVLAVEKLLEKEVPFHEAQAHLLITLDGNDKELIDADYEKIGEICLENQAADVLVADNQQTRDRLWETRRMIIEALQNLSPERIMDTQDIVVPRTSLPEMLNRIKDISRDHALQIISFGHAGDGNVHVNIIKDIPDDTWKRKVPQAVEEIYRTAVGLGGLITGEHGIGLTRKKYLHYNIDAYQIELMKKIKEDFDPNYVLNPGKIFPDDERS